MFHHFSKYASRHLPIRHINILVACILLVCCSPQNVRAQGVFGYFTDSLVYMPQLTGEVKFGPTMMKVIQGQEVYNFYDEAIFFDAFARAGLGRLSARLVYEPRWFNGKRGEKVTQFEFKGLRLGVGFDLIQNRMLNVGISLDQDIYEPQIYNFKFKYDSEKFEDKLYDAVAKPPLSLGAYGAYTAPLNFYGMSPVVDGSFRISAMGAGLQDYKISGGLKLPTTVLGTVSILGGYQNTAVQFNKNDRAYDESTTPAGPGIPIDIRYAGWFIELGYIY